MGVRLGGGVLIGISPKASKWLETALYNTHKYSQYTQCTIRHTYSYEYTLYTVCTHSTLCTHIQVHLNKLECREIVHFFL